MAIDLNISISINNNLSTGISVPVVISQDDPIFYWSFRDVDIVNVDTNDGTFSLSETTGQLAIELKIADNDSNISTDSFIGNMSTIDVISWSSRSWKYAGKNLERGKTYYGQLRIIDIAGQVSDYIVFSFFVNNLPSASDVKLSPTSPTVNDDLLLTYTYFDIDGDEESETLIRWFKNGIYQRNFNNIDKINSSYLQIGDVWYADVLPFDGLEYGERVSSNSIKVIKQSSSIVTAEISPKNPNTNDILKADYKVDTLIANEEFIIRWFVNDVIQNDFLNQQYIRYDAQVGDIVRYEIKTLNDSLFLSSEEVTIEESEFIIFDIKIEGDIEPLEVSTSTPNVTWKTHKPNDKNVNYTRIQIGTFYEANNIFEYIIENDKENYTIPMNILKRGIDYYITIASSDTLNFSTKYSTHFRIKGSRWSDSVDNAKGWTIETIYLIQDVADFDPEKYQMFKISDGSYFAEIRLYNNKIAFVSKDFIYADMDSSKRNLLTIVGKGQDVKIYLDRKLVIDASGKFLQTTQDKILEVGNKTGQSFSFTYKYIYYTTSGNYYPGEDQEYSKMQFYTFLWLENNDIVSLQGYTDNIEGINIDTKIFATNPYDINESGKLYSILSADKYLLRTVSKTYSPINKIRKSPNGKKIGFAHAKGASFIEGYLINPFDFEIDFTVLNSEGTFTTPDMLSWEKINNNQNNPIYFDSGLNINTIN